MKRYKTFIRESKIYPEYVYRVLAKYDLDEEKYNDMVKRLNSFYKNVFKPLKDALQEFDGNEVRLERNIESMLRFYTSLNGLPTQSVISSAFTDLEDIYPDMEMQFGETLIAPKYTCTVIIKDNTDFNELKTLIETIIKCASRCKLVVYEYRTNGNSPLRFEFKMRPADYKEPQ